MEKKYMNNELILCDCLEYMKSLPDNSFDFGIADPPYGIGKDWEKRDWRSRQRYRGCKYMNSRPCIDVFIQLQRVCKNWMVWGWNYFTDMVEVFPPTNYLVVWDKMSNCNPMFHYSKCEIAATNIKIPCNLVSIGWDGYRMGEETGTKKIHPHQKPVALYRWILRNYAKEGWRILDPFAGSAALGVACKELGFDYVGCEVEQIFFNSSVQRLRGTKESTKHE